MKQSTTQFLSIDIGGTYIKHALINGSGQIISLEKISTPTELGHFKKALATIVTYHQDTIKAIAISSPGKIDSENGVIYHGGSLTFLHEFQIKSFMEKLTQLPCHIMNDGKAAALAELWLGQLKGIQNGGVMTLGTGVGGGLILDGTLHSGSHFQAGELSFMFLSANYPADVSTIAGARGSAVNFIKQAASALALADSLDGKTVFNELEKKNTQIYPLFESFCRDIAFIIINLQSVVDLEKIAIGGGISAQPLLVEEIKKQYLGILNSIPLLSSMLTPVELTTCHFRNEAGLLGALYHLLEKLETNH